MKNGFTLIELLAVIVVLAIIALIAVPVVLNIINEAKESSLLRSAEFYLSAVDYTIANAFLYHGGLESGTYLITPEGNICKTALPCDSNNTLKVEVSGDKPTGGSITIEGGVISDVELTLDDRKIVKNNEGKLVYQTSICKLISGDKETLGSKYECEVKPRTKYNFYVLSTESDGTTNLIMDRNICSDGTPATTENTCTVAWVSKTDYNDDENYGENGNNDKGPITAMNYLNEATSTWSNVPNLNITYNDEGGNFTNFIVTGKARLPYSSEAKDCWGWEDISYPYLYDNLEVECYNGDGSITTCDEAEFTDGVFANGIEHINGIKGYLIFSSLGSDSSYVVHVDWFGDVTYTTASTTRYGVRPVINVKL